MSASRQHRHMSRSRAPLGGATLIAALVVTAFSSSLQARAQDSWLPVVIATAPPQEPAIVDMPSRAKPRPASRAASAPAPLAPKSSSMPPLATVAAQTATAAAAEQRPAPAEAPEGEAKMARDYCNNIVDAASDARFAWQKKVIAELEQEVAKRVEVLEARTSEYQRWLARRDEFSKKAQETVVTIYARMKPESAAAQLVAMDEETAAAVLTKLDPRNASAILSEMEPTQAARLTATISGASNVNLPGRPKSQSGDKKS